MKSLTLSIPDSVNMESRELAMVLAARLYEQGRLSLGKPQMWQA